MAGRPFPKYAYHESKFVPNRPNRNDMKMQWNKEEQKANALESITKLQTGLKDLLNSRSRSSNREECENYLVILDKLKNLIVKSDCEKIYTKCMRSLHQITQGIPKLEGHASSGSRHANSPDSTGIFVDLTSDSRSSRDQRSSDLSDIPIPDSTMNEILHNRLNGFNEPVNLNEVDNEVSSSQNLYKTKNSHPIPDYPVVPKTIFSLRRENDSRHKVDKIAPESPANNVADPVKLIMNVAKATAGCSADKTENSDGNEPRNPSSLAIDIDPIENERLLTQALSNLNKIDDDLIETFSRNSQEEIEGYEDSVKSKFYDRDSEIIELDDFSNQANPTREPRPSVTSMLPNLLDEASNRGTDHSDTVSSRRSSGANSSTSVGEPSSLNLPNSNSLNLPSTQNVSNNNAEKTESHISARKKLLQQIEVVHKVGESGKINPSLKQLRSDIKKPSTSSTPSETTPQTETTIEKEKSVDSGSSMSISPEECNQASSGGRSPTRSSAPRDGTPFRSSAKASHSYKDPHKRISRYDCRDENRTHHPSPDNRSSFYSRDAHKSRRDSRDYSSDSSRSIGSPRNDGSKYDKSRKFDNRYGRPRSRSRDRSRGGFKPSNSLYRRSPSGKRVNPYSIDRRGQNARTDTASHDHPSTSLESFVNSIGGGRPAIDESSKKNIPEEKRDAENSSNRPSVSGESGIGKKPADKDVKPIIRGFKPKVLKLDTNFSDKMLKKETDKAISETTEPNVDRSDIPPASPLPNSSPLLPSGGNTPDISAPEPRTPQPFSEPSFKPNNTNFTASDPRRSFVNNAMRPNDAFSRVSGADPRLKRNDNLPKITDPRLKNQFPRNDPRKPPNLTDPRRPIGFAGGFENHITRPPFIPNKPNFNESRPPVPFDKYDSKENGSNKHVQSSRPNNIAIACEDSPPKSKPKHKFTPSFSKKHVKAVNKPMNTEMLKETVKKQTTFYSPIADAHPEVERAKTGRGYGTQKPSFSKKFTIPKIKKPTAPAPKEDNRSWDAFTNDSNEDFSTPVIPERKSSFQDRRQSSEKMPQNVGTASSTKEPESSPKVANTTNIAEPEEESWDPVDSPEDNVNSGDASVDNAATRAFVSDDSKERLSHSATKDINGSAVTSYETHKTPAKDPTPSINVLDEEECWDPVDSPDCFINDQPAADDDEPVIVSESSNANPLIIDISDCNNENPRSVESVETLEKEAEGDENEGRVTRSHTPERNNDVIEIHDSDDVERVLTPPRRKSLERTSNVKINEVYSLDVKTTDDNSAPSEQPNAIEREEPTEPESSNLDDKLKKLIADSLIGSKPNLKGKTDEGKELNADDLVSSIAQKLMPEILKHIGTLKNDCNASPASDSVVSSVKHVEENAPQEPVFVPEPQPSTSGTTKRKAGGKRKRRKKKGAGINKQTIQSNLEPLNDDAMNIEPPEEPIKEIETPVPMVKKIEPRKVHRNRELERLHEDLERIRKTKLNIFNIKDVRRCRIKDGGASPSYPELPQRIDTSESEDGVIGSDRKRRKVTGFDTENNRGVGSRKVTRVRSKAIISSDDDSDTSSASVVRNTRVAKGGENDILNSKPCPRHMKVKRFGEAYEKFETLSGVMSRQPIIVLPMGLCDNVSTCVCKTRVECSAGQVDLEPQPSCLNYTKGVTKRAHDSGNDLNTSPPKKAKASSKIKVSPKARRKSKKPTTPRKLEKIRMTISQNIGTQGWNIRKDKKPEASPAKEIPEKPVQVPTQVVAKRDQSTTNPDASTIHTPVTRIEPVVDVKPKIIEDDVNDELEEFPLYNAFKDPRVNEVKIATISVKVFEPGLVFTCTTPLCVNYETRDMKMMSLHLNFLHKQVKCNGTCSVCTNNERYPSLKAAFRHLLHEHLTVSADQQEPMDCQSARVKDEPIDVDQIISDDDDSEDDIVFEPVSQPLPAPKSAPSKVLTTASGPRIPQPISTPNSIPSGSSPMSVETAPKATMPLPNVEPVEKPKPKLRVRRLSGDKLSGCAEPSPSVGSLGVAVSAQNQGKVISHVSVLNSKNLSPHTSITGPHCDNFSDICEDFNPIIDDLNSPEVYRIRLYHCSVLKCDFTSDDDKEFLQHLYNTHRAILHKNSAKRSKKLDPSSLICVYCKEKFDTPEMLLKHLEKYKGCRFQCAYCAFRASRPIFLVWHQNIAHPSEQPRILAPDYDDNKLEVLAFATTEEKDRKEIVLPLNCIHCHTFNTISLQEYKDHWKKNHSQTNIWPCQQCESQFFTPDMHIKHLTLHGLGEYQCVYCKSGAATEDAMKMHLMNNHRTLYPKVVKRITPTNAKRGDIFENSLEELDWDECVDNLKNRLHAVNNRGLSAVTLYKDTSDETDPTARVAVTGIYKINEKMEYVLDLEETKKHRESAKPSATRARRSTNETTNVENTNDANTISVDSSDDDTNDRLVICEDTVPVEAPVVKNTQSKPNFVTGLSGVDLYKCGFSGCTASFEDYHSFKEHLSTCDNARTRTSPRCPHCNRNFQQNAKFLGHMALHSVPRFLCSICDAKFTNAKKSEDHLKQTHKVTFCKVMPANPMKSNVYEDLFIVVPNPDKGIKGAIKQCKKTLDAKINASPTATSAKPKDADNTAKRITKVYTYEEVEKNLPMQLFSEPVTCGICSTYSSKVRTNIINHLKCHSTGLVPEKDITNPVPCMDKSELMFNKMTNHAAYSATKTDDKKIKCLIEKVEAYSGKKNEIIPGFVPKTLRFSCNAPDCHYISTDANRLKSHWETLHSDLEFSCCHCGVTCIPVEKIPSHLRYHDGRLFKCYYCTKVHYQRQALERHQLENHALSAPSIQVIRDLSAEEVEELSRDARLNYDKPYDSGIGKFVRTSQWKCNLCKFPPSLTENDIKSHCFGSHGISRRYKCCLCAFGEEHKEAVANHMRATHESVSRVVVTIYSELTDGEENVQSSSESESPSKSVDHAYSAPSRSRSPRNLGGGSNKTQNMATRSQTSDSKEQRKSQQDEEVPQNEDIKHLFILPLPKNRYKCPYCNNFTSESREIITDHLYQENNYMKYVCMTCGVTGATEHEIFKHTKATQHSEENIAKLTEDEVIENQIEQILNYQRSKFDQVNKEIVTTDSIMIDDSEDELTTNVMTSLVEDVLPSSKVTTDLKCPHCPKKCLSSSGLKNHISTKHKPKNTCSTSGAEKKSKISATASKTNAIGVYPCPFCQEEFPANDVLYRHLCTCPKYKSKGITSPIKLLEKQSTVKCLKCDQKIASNNAAEHISNCKAQPTVRSKEKKKCVLCAFEGDDASIAKHTRAEHEPMECLNCNKVLIGTKELEHHVRLSVININGPDEDCVAQEKEVVFMCPYCPFGFRGQTYEKYMYVSNHMETKHSPKAKPQPIMVKINNSKRELLEIEIANMQNKFNNEQNQSATVGAVKKRRNVAVKSTSRLAAASIAQDSRTPLVSKVQRVQSDFEPTYEPVFVSTPKFNIFHGRRADYDSRRT